MMMITTGSMTTMTDNPVLKHIRSQNEKLREHIAEEVSELKQTDLRAILRMIRTWKGLANE